MYLQERAFHNKENKIRNSQGDLIKKKKFCGLILPFPMTNLFITYMIVKYFYRFECTAFNKKKP